MTPIETSQSSSLAGTLTPEALFLSGFDPETVHPKNVRTAGVCGFSGVVDDAACLSCFFFRPPYSLGTRNQLLRRRQSSHQLRPQRPHVAFQLLDGKGCHYSRKTRTQRLTRGRFFRVLTIFSPLPIHWFAPQSLRFLLCLKSTSTFREQVEGMLLIVVSGCIRGCLTRSLISLSIARFYWTCSNRAGPFASADMQEIDKTD